MPHEIRELGKGVTVVHTRKHSLWHSLWHDAELEPRS